MVNQFYTKGKQFDYLDFESELRRLGKKKYVTKIFQEAENDYDLFLAKIKSLGLEIDEYSVKQHNNPFLKNYDIIFQKELSSENKEKILNHLFQVDQLNHFFVNSNIAIDKIIEENSEQTNFLLSQFIVYLEYCLRLLRNGDITDISLEETTTSFDYYITSSGVILKYLLHKISFNNQRGCNRIFSEEDLLWNLNVYNNYVERDNLMDAFEYWKYSRIEIIERESTPLVDFADEEFNRAVLVGNFRHKNFMRDIELDIVNYKKDRGIIKSDDSFDKIYIDHVSNELCLRYFGKENMSTLIFGVELRKWIDSIHFFQYEAIHFLEKKKKISFLRFKTYVLSERSLSGKKS